jgi:hypothetical protein
MLDQVWARGKHCLARPHVLASLTALVPPAVTAALLTAPMMITTMLIVPAAILVTPTIAQADTGQYMRALEQDQFDLFETVIRLLTDQKYEELEQLASRYREDKSRTSTGTPRLEMFYRSLQYPETAPGQYTVHALDDRVQHLEAWLKARPSRTVKLALAATLEELAWVARGGGFADTITADNSRIMDSAIAQAEQLLQELTEEEVDQDVYRYRVEMSLGILNRYDRSRMEDLLHAALELSPYETQSIETMVLYLLPRWYGREGELVELADRLAAEHRDASGEFTYAAVASRAYDFGEYRRFDEDNSFEWSRVRQGHIDWLKAEPDSPRVWGRQAYFAKIAGDRPTAREAFEHLQGRYIKARWKDQHHLYEQALRWAFDVDGPGESDVLIDLPAGTPFGFAYSQKTRSVIPNVRDSRVTAFSIESGERLFDDSLWPDRFHSACSDPGGKVLFISVYRNAGGVNIIQTDREAGKARLIGGTDFNFSTTAVSANGKMIAINDQGGALKYWTVTSEPVPLTISTGFERLDGIALSPDARQIAAAQVSTIKVWNTKTREQIRTWETECKVIDTLCWSSNGKMLASSGDSSLIQIWDAHAGTLLTDLDGETGWYRKVAFSPDDKYLVAGGYSLGEDSPPGDILVFDIATKKIIRRYQGHRMNVLGLMVTPDQKQIISSGADGSIRVWKMPDSEEK